MPREDCTVYAKWETQKVNYTVRHLQEVVHNEEVEANSVEIDPSIAEEEPIEENNFELVEEEVFSAKTGEMVTPAVKSYTGFTAPETVTEKVLGDGSLVVNIVIREICMRLIWYLMAKKSFVTGFSMAHRLLRPREGWDICLADGTRMILIRLH